MTLKKALDADFRFYSGYRATFELQTSYSADVDNIKTIVKFLESDLIYTQLWHWASKKKFTPSAEETKTVDTHKTKFLELE